MEKYYYTKAISVEALADRILLDDTMYPIVVGTAVATNMDGTVPDDNIEIQSEIVWNSTQLDAMASIINMLGPMDTIMIRSNIEKAYIQPAVAFGNAILSKVSAYNVSTQKTSEEVDNIMVELNAMIIMLLIGNIGGAERELQALRVRVVGGESILGVELSAIDEFLKRFDRYLNP